MEEHYNKTQNTPDEARRKVAAGSGAERFKHLSELLTQARVV